MSGGGGSSGAVSYPAYMQDWHLGALTHGLTVAPVVSLTEAMDEALYGLSPYSGFVIPDADDILLGAGKVIGDFTAPFAYLTTYASQDFDELFAKYKNTTLLASVVANKETTLTAMFEAESALVDNDIAINVLPQFRGGMRDINAVMSSAFVVGESNIHAQKELGLAKSDASFRYDAEKFYAELTLRCESQAMALALNFIEFKKGIAVTSSELARMYATITTELSGWQLENEAKDRLWDLKVFQFGGNFLGSIAGSAIATDDGHSTTNRLGSAAAGALGGAVSGYMIGNAISPAVTNATTGVTSGGGGGYGAAIGAVAGGVMSYFSNN